ncbi:hypothetical protein ACH4GE_34395 [Streptomyces tendae]|uniref:hypothetical protein n=1 Tax=Streptomyces tendae TaxID=1932 RepID=UPI0037AA070F
MPTFETLPRFAADLQHLTPAQHQGFRRVVLDAFVPDLRTGRQICSGLQIKGVRCAPGIYELTWAPDGPGAPGSPTSYGNGLGPTAS